MRIPRVRAALLCFAAPAALAQGQTGAARPRPVAGALGIGDPYFPGLGNGGYEVEHYDLELDLDMESNELAATARIRAHALEDLASFSLDLYGLEVEGVRVDGREARFERPAPAQGSPAPPGRRPKPAELVVFPAEPLAGGARFTAEVRYGGSPGGRPDPSVPFLPQGVGWMRGESGVFVLSECSGASGWFPCNDHPRDKATYGFRVTVAKPYTVAANGVLERVIEQDEARTFVFAARDPMATYLATVNVAEFGVLSAEGPRGIPVRIYHPADAPEAELADFRRQPEVLEFLETVFGPYPFEAAGGVLSQEPIPGALECQTLPVYGRGSDLEVIVHELAHQWFGDCVSPDLWRDMWLNEGFASYAEWLWVEHARGEGAYEARARQSYATLRKAKVGSPFDPGVEQVFSGRVYQRGAFVLHGLRVELGDETFFRVLASWVESHRNANASTADFVAHASRTAGRDLSAFFDGWLYADVTPEIPAYEPAPGAPEERGKGE